MLARPRLCPACARCSRPFSATALPCRPSKQPALPCGAGGRSFRPRSQPKILLTNGFQDEEPYFILPCRTTRCTSTLRRLPLAHYRRLQWNGVHEWNFWDRSLVYAIDYFFAPRLCGQKTGRLAQRRRRGGLRRLTRRIVWQKRRKQAMNSPLADRLRPRTLAEVCGQQPSAGAGVRVPPRRRKRPARAQHDILRPAGRGQNHGGAHSLPRTAACCCTS